MKRHTILVLVCTFLLAADAPQKPSFQTHETVAKAYYAEVQQAAEAEKKAEVRRSKAMRSETLPMPKVASGLVVDRQGKPTPGARVVVEREASDEVLGEGTTNATGKFEVTLSTQSYKGLTLTVTKDGFNRWAMGGLYGGIVDYRVRLDQVIDDTFWKARNTNSPKEPNHIMHDHQAFFVGWGTLSLINAGLAQSKGRSGLLWWLASLFIGPLATLLIVVLPKVPTLP